MSTYKNNENNEIGYKLNHCQHSINFGTAFVIDKSAIEKRSKVKRSS